MYSKICKICPHHCNRDHDTICQQNSFKQNAKEIQTTSIAIDSIEKKPLYHYMPGTKTLSIGTIGCNLKCKNCQNHEIAQPKKLNDVTTTIITPKDIINVTKKHELKSITWTYNEPTIHPNWIIETAREAKKENIKTLLVTNGYSSKETNQKLIRYIDAVNIDIKSMNNQFYENICGGKLKPILNTIETYLKNKIHIEITNLIIPQHNDNIKTIKKLSEYISNLSNKIPLHFTRFYPQYKMINTSITPEKTIDKAYNIAKNTGLKYVYPGNIKSSYKSHTYCPHCKKTIIKRDNYLIKNYITKQNACPHCNHKTDIIL